MSSEYLDAIKAANSTAALDRLHAQIVQDATTGEITSDDRWALADELNGRAAELGEMPRAYLAGPMTGYPDYNAAGFAAAAAWAAEQGWSPVSPHDTDPGHPGDCPPGERHKGHPNACWYAAGVRVLLGCQVLVLLPEWRQSTGSNLELAVAEIARMRVVNYPPEFVAEAPRLRTWDRDDIPPPPARWTHSGTWGRRRR